jgi:simple sugar transport system ATP-binding protein
MIGEIGAATPDVERRAVEGEERPLLEVEDLWVRDDRGSHAVRGVSLAVRPGEVLGIAGVEGSGQLELTEAIAGVRPVERGRIRVDGRDVTGLRVRERHAEGIAHVPADRLDAGLVPTLSIAENLALPVIGDPPLSRFGTLRLGGLRALAQELIRRFNIATPGPDLEARALSGGNQQKLVLARELSRDPRVLVCCYPTRGLDFSATGAVQREIVDRRGAGAAILYASVELDELLGLTDRIIVLHNGSLTGELPTSQATAEQLGLLMGGTAA